MSKAILKQNSPGKAMDQLMTSPFDILTNAVKTSLPQVTRAKNWREQLRHTVGDKLGDVIWDLAQGKAWYVELPDGQVSAPIVPSSDVRAKCAMFLHETLYGRAVPQTEVQRAELEAKEMASVHALSDAELHQEAHRILEARRVQALGPGATQYAEFTEVPAPAKASTESDEIITLIWSAPPTEDQDT